MQYQETQMQSFTYKSKKSIRSTLAIGLFALGACASQSVLAADWPTKPVKVIVAFTAGGTTDILAREVSHGLTQKGGQSVVGENRSEERRVGTECGRKWRSRWSPYH